MQALHVESSNVPAYDVEPVEAITDTERAVYGAVTSLELRAFLDGWTTGRLGSPIKEVRFRAGRIDVVWGVELEDGRAVVIKTHRPPVDIDAARGANDAQRLLATAGFPCAVPLAGPDEVEGRILTAETLMDGHAPDGRVPANRLLLAEGLARHIDILRDHSDLVRRAGPGHRGANTSQGPGRSRTTLSSTSGQPRPVSSGSTPMDSEPLNTSWLTATLTTSSSVTPTGTPATLRCPGMCW